MHLCNHLGKSGQKLHWNVRPAIPEWPPYVRVAEMTGRVPTSGPKRTLIHRLKSFVFCAGTHCWADGSIGSNSRLPKVIRTIIIVYIIYYSTTTDFSFWLRARWWTATWCDTRHRTSIIIYAGGLYYYDYTNIICVYI